MFSVARAVRAPEWGAEYPVPFTPNPAVALQSYTNTRYLIPEIRIQMVCSGHRSGTVRFWRLVPSALAKRTASPSGGGTSFRALEPFAGIGAISGRVGALSSGAGGARLALVHPNYQTHNHNPDALSPEPLTRTTKF